MDRHEPQVHSTSTETEVTKSNRVFNGVGNFLRDNKNKLAATAAAAALTITLAGCGANAQEQGPEPTTTTSQEETPTPEPEQTPEMPVWYNPEDVIERDTPMPESLEKYKEMSIEEFAALDKAEQWLYVSWLTEYRAKFSDWYYIASGSVQGRQPFELTPESTTEQKLEFANYSLRMALYSTEGVAEPHEGGSCGPLDVDAASKITLATYYSPGDNPTTALNKIEEMKNTLDGNAVCPSKQGAKNMFGSNTWTINEVDQRDLMNHGDYVSSTVIEYTEKDGASAQYMGIAMVPYTTFDGKEAYASIIQPLKAMP